MITFGTSRYNFKGPYNLTPLQLTRRKQHVSGTYHRIAVQYKVWIRQRKQKKKKFRNVTSYLRPVSLWIRQRKQEKDKEKQETSFLQCKDEITLAKTFVSFSWNMLKSTFPLRPQQRKQGKHHQSANGNTRSPSCFRKGFTCFCDVSVYGFSEFRPVHAFG